MTEPRVSREPDPGFVGRLVPDPASPPELTLLVGYPGASPEKESLRLYASPDLSRWWDVPEDDVLHRQTVPGDPLGAEIVWVRRDKQPVLNPRRPEPDMFTTTIISHNIPCTPPTTPVGAAAAVPTRQNFPTESVSCTCQPTVFLCTLFCNTLAAAANPPATQLCTFPPPYTAGCTYNALQAQGHAQVFTTVPTALNLCTVLPHSFGCPPQTQAGAQFFATGPVHHTPFCTTTPVGAGPINTLQIPATQHCTYGGAQGHPFTNVTVAYPPHTHDPQQCFNRTYVWPPTQDVNCGTSPVAQAQQTWVRPQTQDVYCGTSPVAQAVPQQTYVLPTLGPGTTLPPQTVCCAR